MRMREQVKWFLIALSFGQLVPMIIWVDGFRFEWFTRILRSVALQPPAASSTLPNADPLKTYIKRKIRTHGGFLVESLIESVPQSILQMAGLIINETNNPVAIFSLCMSMVSVASKGLVLSYSIHRPTFVFNFLAFAADVCGVFATVAWIFIAPPSQSDHGVFFMTPPVNKLAQLWVYKALMLCVLWYFLVLGIFICVFLDEMNCDRYASGARKRQLMIQNFIFLSFLFVFGHLIYLPCMIAVGSVLAHRYSSLSPSLPQVEGLKFTLLPLFVFKSLSNEYASNASLYGRLFDWLLDGSKEDRLEKLKIFNRLVAGEYLSDLAGRPPRDFFFKSELKSTRVATKIIQSTRTAPACAHALLNCSD